LVLGSLAIGVAVAASMPEVAAQRPPVPAGLQLFRVQANVYMIAGAGGNITVQVGPDGVVLVDAGSTARAEDVVAAVRSITDSPIRYIINTGPGADHIGGNEKVAAAGQNIATRDVGPLGAASATASGGAASIIGTEELLGRMSAGSGEGTAAPPNAWPTETFTTKHKDLFINREGIQVFSEPAAHSDSDAIVLFRRSDVIATGDIFDITRFPVIDVAKGGSIEGEIAALNHLIDLTIPSVPLPWLDEGGTQVIPGHGRPCEEAEVVEYRDMVTIIRDRVQALIKKRMTLAQVNAANPTQGFRARYGADSGPWTTDMFVEAVYKSLTAAK
jgi:glyoxylase-like metal-dependent hydrolase (beta-lactamase superfamily II)